MFIATSYPGDGLNHWAAVHRLDAVRLFRLALERGAAGRMFHTVDDEGVEVWAIADAIGRRLGLPVTSVPRGEDAIAHFGWLGAFFGTDVRASSVLTRQWRGWRIEGPGLLADLELGRYFKA